MNYFSCHRQARSAPTTRPASARRFRACMAAWETHGEYRAFRCRASLWPLATMQFLRWHVAHAPFAGRHVQSIVRGQPIAWGRWRGRTPGLPPM